MNELNYNKVCNSDDTRGTLLVVGVMSHHQMKALLLYICPNSTNQNVPFDSVTSN